MSDFEVTVRPMTANDRQGILAIDAAISGKHRALSWQQRVENYLEVHYPGIRYVAEVEGKVIGFILGGIRGWEYGLPRAGWIDVLGILPQYQGQDIGRKLVEAFANECRRLKMGSVHSIIREDDGPVQDFLGAAGFRRGPLIDLRIDL